MGIIQQIQCDVCGKVRQQVNHWFLVEVHNGEWLISVLEVPVKIAEVARSKVVCGEDCALRLLSQWFDRQRPHPAQSDERGIPNEQQRET